MKNYDSRGSLLPFNAPSDVISGQGVAIGDMFTVATSDYKSGEEGVFLVTGVVKLPKAAGDSFVAGKKVYWDGTNITLTATDNTFAGYYVGAEGNLALVRLPL